MTNENIAGIAEDFMEWQKTKSTVPEVGYGIEDMVHQGLRDARDYSPRQPNLFLKELNDILRSVQTDYHDDPSALMFKETATKFINEIQPEILSRRPVVVPKEIQRKLIELAGSFVKNARVISDLNRLFKDEYTTHIHRYRCAAAEFLRRLAKILLERI